MTIGRPASSRNRVSKGGSEKRTASEKREYIRHRRPSGLSIAEGCRLMGLSRSTYYDEAVIARRRRRIVAAMTRSAMSSRAYGYRRVGAELRHRGMVVNPKKIRRLMREHDLQPSVASGLWPRPTATTTCRSFPTCARTGWSTVRTRFGSQTSPISRILTGFVYLAAILDAWSREPSGMRSAAQWMRGSLAALKAAIERATHRRAASITPIAAHNMHPRSIVTLLADHGLVGSMGGAATPTTMPKLRAS